MDQWRGEPQQKRARTSSAVSSSAATQPNAVSFGQYPQQTSWTSPYQQQNGTASSTTNQPYSYPYSQQQYMQQWAQQPQTQTASSVTTPSPSNFPLLPTGQQNHYAQWNSALHPPTPQNGTAALTTSSSQTPPQTQVALQWVQVPVGSTVIPPGVIPPHPYAPYQQWGQNQNAPQSGSSSHSRSSNQSQQSLARFSNASSQGTTSRKYVDRYQQQQSRRQPAPRQPAPRPRFNGKTPEEILALCEASSLTAIDCVAAMSQLAKACKFARMSHPAVKRLRRDKRCLALVHRICAAAGVLHTKHIATTLVAMAKMDWGRDSLLERMYQEATAKAGYFNAQDIGNTVWTMATLAYCDESLLRRMCVEAKIKASTFNPQNVANTVWAMATLAHRNEGLLRVICEDAITKADSFNPQDIVNILWGLCAMDYLHEKLFTALADPLLNSISGKLGVEALSQVLYIHMFLRCEHPDKSHLLNIPQSVISAAEKSHREALKDILSSKLDLTVSQALREEIVEGVTIQDKLVQSGITIGIACWNDDVKVALEVDGPTHFSRTKPFRELGPTLFKVRLLRAMDWEVVAIPYWEVNELTSEELSLYIRKRLEDTAQGSKLLKAHKPEQAPPAAKAEKSSPDTADTT
eukprot:gb/GEZN01003935.1/.p1 GENE.gb/GEZN01003935.1/~~gb/GEZN01003935.1/.p1  ORF type:complete len:634 (+),score=75.15 gb/GEZN01003935.1/:33-1934(+)